MVSLHVSTGFVIVTWGADGYRVSVWGGGDSRLGGLMTIKCQCGVGVIVAWGADGYRVSVWSGGASYSVVSPNQLVYSQKFPLPPIPLFSFVFSQSPAVNCVIYI